MNIKVLLKKLENNYKLFHKLIDVLTYRLEKIQQIRVQALILIKELEGLKGSLCNYCGNQLTKEQAKEKKNKRIKIRNKLRNLKVDKLDKFKDFTNKLIQTTRSCFNTVGIELEKYIHIISYEEALKKQQEEYFDKLHQLELEKIPSNDQIKEELKSNKYLLLTELGALIKLNYKILKSLKQTLHDSHIQYEGYLEWKKIFKNDLRHFFFLNVTKFLTNRSNYYIKQLGNPQIKISFVLEENKLGVSVRSETGGENYDMFSGGEQQLTSFAVSLALADLAESQIGSECGFTVLDEPFTNLGEINYMSFRQTLKNLHYLDSLNNDPINFHICSEGGLLDYAYSLYDHMQSINSPTNTIGSGFICSAAVILLICGTNKRMATETSSVMLHPAESQVSGNVEHMEANKNMLSLSEEVRYNLFAKHTRWPAAKWKKKEREKREIWFSPKEMLSMGMIDEIVKN